MFIDSSARRLLLALTWFGVATATSGLSCAIGGNSGQHTPPPSLQLTTRILGEEYCKGDSELDGLRLKLRLIYTNQSKQNLLLFKGSRLMSRIMIGRDFGEMAAKHFEVNSSVTQVTSGGEDCYKGVAPSKCFVVLPPGASYEAEGVAGTFAVRGDVREIAGAVKSGNHVLQVEVVTWQDTNEMAKDLRARWQQSGMLWYEPITSEPVEFTVSRDRNVVECP